MSDPEIPAEPDPEEEIVEVVEFMDDAEAMSVLPPGAAVPPPADTSVSPPPDVNVPPPPDAAIPAPDAAIAAPAQEHLEWEEGHPDWFKPHEKNSDAPQKLSALSLAVLIHVAVFAVLGLIIVSMPRPNAPQIVAAVAPIVDQDQVENVQISKISRQVNSSSSAKPTVAVSSMGISDVAIPEFDVSQSMDVTVGAANYDLGTGLSFSADGAESMVNFFGIKSKGKRIAFIVDAERYMLTDDKGGMPAYEKVKDEIGKIMAGLNRDTAFNLLIYEGKRLGTFREELVAATPSNVRLAIEWLKPLNTVYESIGVRGDIYNSVQVHEGIEPILHNDISGFPKAIQACLEMDVHTIFIIASGWRHMGRTPTEEEKADMAKLREKVWNDEKQAKMDDARKKAQEWLRKENEARREQGVAPKVIVSLWPIMRKLVPGVEAPPTFRGYSMDEVEDHFKNGIRKYYTGLGKPKPSINLVWFIGEDEEPRVSTEDLFKDITRTGSRGKLKILKGLAAVENVTGR